MDTHTSVVGGANKKNGSTRVKNTIADVHSFISSADSQNRADAYVRGRHLQDTIVSILQDVGKDSNSGRTLTTLCGKLIEKENDLIGIQETALLGDKAATLEESIGQILPVEIAGRSVKLFPNSVEAQGAYMRSHDTIVGRILHVSDPKIVKIIVESSSASGRLQRKFYVRLRRM